MPVYYDSMDLSAAEKQRFFIGAAAIGMTAGLLFYDSPIIGIVITLCSGLFLSKYKMMMTEKKKSELLIEFRDLLYSICFIGQDGGSGSGGIRGFLEKHI